MCFRLILLYHKSSISQGGYTLERSLVHYFDESVGPFRSITDLDDDEAQKILDSVRANKPNTLCASRDPEYLRKRRNCERIVREDFVKRGGLVARTSPYYLVLEPSPWLSTWFEHPAFVKIPVSAFDLRYVSFTYGDSMPTFSPRCADGKEYRGRTYDYDGIEKMIAKYGLPQEYNDDGRFGSERYIEAHVWEDSVIIRFLKENGYR